MTTHGDRINERLIELGWSKAFLAAKADIQPATLSRLLTSNDVKHKRAVTLRVIARELGVSAEWLLNGEKPNEKTEGECVCTLNQIEEDMLARLYAVVEAYAEYLDDKSYKIPPAMLADGVKKLFLESIRENTYDKIELKQIITGERMVVKTDICHEFSEINATKAWASHHL